MIERAQSAHVRLVQIRIDRVHVSDLRDNRRLPDPKGHVIAVTFRLRQSVLKRPWCQILQ